jgi:Lon protease-like protein
MLTDVRPRLPLFPLPDVVHFPRTVLKLHVFEPRYRQLVRDLAERDERLRWIGMVLLEPGARDEGFGAEPPIFREGTAGRLVDVEALPDGRSNIVLQGDFRFLVEREIDDLSTPYRQAVVRPLEEMVVDEGDSGVLAVRREILEVAEVLDREMGERFPLRLPDLKSLVEGGSFETLVNSLAAELDLPARRKLALLEQSLIDRSVEVLEILRSRQRVLDLLRPFRHLAEAAEQN